MSPKSLRAATVKALSAAHAVGFTHHGPGPFTNYDWAVDDRCWYHAVQRRNPRGGQPTVRHACRDLHDLLTAQLRNLSTFSHEHCRIQLGLCCPSWQCSGEGDWLPTADPAAAVAAIYSPTVDDNPTLFEVAS